MECLLEADPPPTIAWQHSGVLLPPSSRCIQTLVPQEGILYRASLVIKVTFLSYYLSLLSSLFLSSLFSITLFSLFVSLSLLIFISTQPLFLSSLFSITYSLLSLSLFLYYYFFPLNALPLYFIRLEKFWAKLRAFPIFFLGSSNGYANEATRLKETVEFENKTSWSA